MHASLQELLEVYKDERYVLVWRGSKGQVLQRDDATSLDALRAVWQVGADNVLWEPSSGGPLWAHCKEAL